MFEWLEDFCGMNVYITPHLHVEALTSNATVFGARACEETAGISEVIKMGP